MDPAFKPCYRITSDRVEWTPAPKESFAVARTSRADQPEALQGFHCDNLLFILDEASGIPERIFEVAEGALTAPGAKQLLTSNPTQTSGYFYDTHNKMRDRFFTMRIDHSMSDRVSDQYVEDMARKWGTESNVYRVRVLGEFPKSDANSVISLELVEAAAQRDVVSYGEVVWGLDVARFGEDDSALAKRCANATLEKIKVWRDLNTMQLVGAVMREYDNTPYNEQPDDLYVDVIGMGAGVVDRFDELNTPFVVHPVNVAEVATHPELYMRLRDQLWFEAREWLEARACSLVEDEELFAEWTTVLYHPPTSTGKLKVFSKDEMKRPPHNLRSPNRADAMNLTFAHRFTDRIRKSKNVGYARRKGKNRENLEPNTNWVV
jgi:hypothetical protein